MKKIVLAYSGGLDTSVMLRWLRERYGCEVVCYCADVGQGEELAGLGEKAKRTGASKLYVEDLRREGADAVAHGATGKGNDQVRFELTYYALEPHIRVVAAWREWEFKG